MNLTAEGFEVLTASRGDTGVEQALRETSVAGAAGYHAPRNDGSTVPRAAAERLRSAYHYADREG